ncbi:MAG: ROK family transcriptional regulator [Spirochaetales bacterium]|nr:ROK family transcriptional regulator [Spirochaetales bacterium]
MKQVKKTKTMNTSLVIRELWRNRKVSRIEIARTLGLNKSTITHIVNDLLERRLVSQVSEGEASPQGGRKPVYLSLDKDFGAVLGIEIRPESYTAVSVDLHGNVRFFRTESREVNADNLTVSLLDIIRKLMDEQKESGVPLLGIGIGMSGVINPLNGCIVYSIPLGVLSEYDFQAQVASDIDLPLMIENDANCCCWGELAFHRTRELQNFLFVLVEFRNIEGPGRGFDKIAVGLGVVINGKVHYGKNFSAGEFRSVFRNEKSEGQFGLNTGEAFSIERDPKVLEKFVGELSRNIALLVNSFNLSQVFLGGDIERYQVLVQKTLSEEIQRNWPYPNKVECEINFSSLGDRSVAYGAAGMILDRLFENPDTIIEQSG